MHRSHGFGYPRTVCPMPLTGSNGDPRIDAVAALVEHVRTQMIPSLFSRPDRAPRQYAAAALARCNRLLAAMIVLRDAGFPDVIGGLLRSLLECWYLGMYFYLSPDEAFERTSAAHLHQLTKLDEARWGDFDHAFWESHVDPKGMSWEHVSNRVGTLLAESGNVGAKQTADGLYEVIYRGESMMSVHGGVASLIGHIAGAGTASMSLAAVRLEPDDGGLRIRMGGPLLETLARSIAYEFGLDRTEIDRLGALLNDQ
jgi:hypothetical protein